MSDRAQTQRKKPFGLGDMAHLVKKAGRAVQAFQDGDKKSVEVTDEKLANDFISAVEANTKMLEVVASKMDALTSALEDNTDAQYEDENGDEEGSENEEK